VLAAGHLDRLKTRENVAFMMANRPTVLPAILPAIEMWEPQLLMHRFSSKCQVSVSADSRADTLRPPFFGGFLMPRTNDAPPGRRIERP